MVRVDVVRSVTWRSIADNYLCELYLYLIKDALEDLAEFC
jgi:hypothetical protein